MSWYLVPSPLNSGVRFTDTRSTDEILADIQANLQTLDRPLPMVAPSFEYANRVRALTRNLIALHRRGIDWRLITRGVSSAHLEDVFFVNGITHRFPDGRTMRRDYYILAHLYGLHPQRDEQIIESIPFNSDRAA